MSVFTVLSPPFVFHVLGCEIETLRGESGCVSSSLEYLLTRHPEILVLRIKESECSDEGLQYILSLGERLTHIQLSRSKITGDGITLSEISSLTTSLPNLEDLDISRCHYITESGFISLLNIVGAQLRKLNLSFLDISLSEISSLSKTLPNLEDLDISRCHNITETGFISLLNIVGARLRKLKMLNFRISLSEISSLTTTLPNLEDLDISECYDITETGFISLLNIVGAHLRKLDMSRLEISLSEISSLTTTLPNLEDLDISECHNITDTGFVSLLNIVGAPLRKLNMNRLEISLSEISSLSTTLPNLEELDISECRNVTETGFISLLNVVGARLRKLDAHGLEIRLSEISSLTTTLANLEDLDISECFKITETGFISLLNNVGACLRKLNMSSLVISLSEISSLTTTLPNLEDLYIIWCRYITETGFISLLNIVGARLRKLNMSWLGISLSEISSLTTTLPNLEDLDISKCRDITETGFISLLNIVGARLRKLNMSWLGISLSEISSLTTTLPNLEDLDISKCRDITETGFISLLNIVGARLRKLNMSWLGISLSEISSLTTTLPNLEDLDISKCRDITETGFISLLNIVGARLRKLNMSWLGISLSEISSLTTTLPNLEDLDISKCRDITETGFISLLNIVGARLRKLNMSSLPISLSEISSLTTTLPNLEELDIHECSLIDPASLTTLLNTAGVLKRLTMMKDLHARLPEDARLTAIFSNLSIMTD